MELCFATNNKHKLEEVRAAVGGNIIIRSLEDIECFEELPETQNTLEGNALQKARFVFDKYQIPCFADDSGLEVEALNGDPGVYSARYAGLQRNDSENTNLLLKNLLIHSNRRARFRTIIALVNMRDKVLFDGVIQGTIATSPKGTQGFGYDPVFMPEGFTTTFAEMSLAEKNKISHRAKAVDKLVNYLRQL